MPVKRCRREPIREVGVNLSNASLQASNVIFMISLNESRKKMTAAP
jgi:hypothetical protein